MKSEQMEDGEDIPFIFSSIIRAATVNRKNGEIMHGIIPLWKPQGMTSHDCVVKLRKLLQIKKAGHTGTLDPGVEGVLPVCIGRATKIVQYLTNADKVYEAEVTLGISTTTEDQFGDIVERKPVKTPVERKNIEMALKKLTGEIIQIPPMYSAVKVKGKRLYEYAREGIEVERPERKVMIYELILLDDQEQFTGEPVKFNIRIKCSKGTYIRTLAVMIGEALGYPAHMSHLVRISQAGITKQDCFTFEEIEMLIKNGRKEEIFIPVETALNELPKLEIHDTLANRVKNGAVLPVPEELKNAKLPIAMVYKGKVIAIYKHHPTKTGLIKPDRVLVTE